MGRTVKGSGKKTSVKETERKARKPLPPSPYSMTTRAIIWLGLLAAMIITMLLLGIR
jgi:hypothetical protein